MVNQTIFKTGIKAPYIEVGATNKQWYVSPTGTGNGSITAPLGTIAEAMTAASANDVIVLLPGIYIEDVTVTKTLGFVGADTNGLTQIQGKTTLSSGSHSFQNIKMYNPGTGATDYSLIVDGAGTGRFTGVVIDRAAGGPTVRYQGTMQGVGSHWFDNSFINGTASMAQTVARAVRIVDMRNTGFDLTMETGNTMSVTVEMSQEIGTVNHKSGVLFLGKVNRIGALSSTAIGVANPLYVTDSSIINATSVPQSVIMTATGNPTTSTVFFFNNVLYNVSGSTLGYRAQFGASATDLSANVVPTNYTPADQSIAGHLTGIDTKLASVTGITQVEDDTSPTLGGDLALNNHALDAGTGNDFTVLVDAGKAFKFGNYIITAPIDIEAAVAGSDFTFTFSYIATYQSTYVDYVYKSTEGWKMGTLFVLNNGTDTSITDMGIELSVPAIDFTATINGSNIDIVGTAVSASSPQDLKITMRQMG